MTIEKLNELMRDNKNEKSIHYLVEKMSLLLCEVYENGFRNGLEIAEKIHQPNIVHGPEQEWTTIELNSFENCCLLIKESDDSYSKEFKDECIRFLMNLRDKSLRPQPKREWSEEDKSILEALIYDIERLPMQGVLTHRPCDSYIKFLKALRPGWKPSEEQLNALNFAITYFMHETNYKNPTELRDLYDDLLKLKQL